MADNGGANGANGENDANGANDANDANDEGGVNGESAVKRIWDKLILEHPVIAVAAVLALTLALVGYGCGAGANSGSGGLGSAGDGGAAGGSGEYGVSGLQQAEVIRVVDGDTLQLSVDGRKERVRLIGINSPESVAPEEERNTAEGADASDHMKTLVHEGDIVWLESDINNRDQYDRLLRYVWLKEPADVDDPDQIASSMLNAIMVRDGYAQARVYGDDDAHAGVLEQLGREAVREGRGFPPFGGSPCPVSHETLPGMRRNGGSGDMHSGRQL